MLVQSAVYNNQTWPISSLYYNAAVICNHCPPPTGMGRVARLMCRAVTFRVPPQCRACAITHIYPMEFIMIKSRAMTLSRSPQCRAFSRAVMDEKSLSPLFPVGVGVGWGAVVTLQIIDCLVAWKARRFKSSSIPFIALHIDLSHFTRWSLGFIQILINIAE